ncbi:hypothetical protein E4N89_06225 [Treponema denticola]|uniref:hypothetical protein n=1 Tax=Treponema denticola TaxID=158 RepID=UPI003D926562
MEFDKSKVYTSLNADELKVGSKVYVSDNIAYLRECIEDNFESCILTRVMSEKEAKRFCIDKSCEKWQLAYLIEPPAEPKYKPFKDIDKAMEAIKKHGGWIKKKSNRYQYIVIAKSSTSLRLSDGWFTLEAIFYDYVFADDGTPCGELEEE